VRFDAVSEGRTSLFVLLRAEDCESHQPVIAALNEAHIRGAVPVRGLVLGDPASASRIMETAFPLETQPVERVQERLQRLGYARTPIVALVDSRGRPMMISEAMDAPWQQVEAVRLAEALARRSENQRG
jgi:hypothetical protein